MVTQVTLGNFYTTSTGKNVLGGTGGSGLDTQTLLKSLTNVASFPATVDQDKITINDKQSTALNSFSSLLSNFQTAADALRNPPGVGNDADNVFKFTTGSVTSNTAIAGGNYISVSTSAGATLQSYKISDITSLAAAASQTTGVLTPDGTTGSIVSTSPADGQFTAGTVTINGQAITLTSGDSINSVAAKFNAVSGDTGISATVIQVSSTQYRLSFTATHTGTANNFDLTSSNQVIDPSGVLTNIGLVEQQKSGIFTLASSSSIAVSASPIAGTSNQFAPGTITIAGHSITLTEGETLDQVATAFNGITSFTGIKATVLAVGTGQFKLSFTSTGSGSLNSFDLTSPSTVTDPSGALAGIGLASPRSGTNAIAGQDALFSINGIAITRSSNSVSDVINGVTFNLLQKTPDSGTQLTVSVQPDTQTTQNSVVRFVTTYNALKVFAAQQTELKSDGTYADTAILANDQTFRSIMADINSQVNAQVRGLGTGAYSSLADIGLSFTNQTATATSPLVYNILNVNDTKLASALASNFSQVSNLFGLNVTSDNPNLKVFSDSNALNVSAVTLNVDPFTHSFTATYGPVGNTTTVDLVATAIAGTSGYSLKGPVGSAIDGLQLIYGSSASATINLKITQGIADKVYNTSATALKSSTGTIAQSLSGLQKSDDILNKDILRVNSYVAQYTTQMTAKFAALETAVSRVNTLLQSLDASQKARLSSSG